MTEQPEQELTPEQEADVRRLLADARHTEPTPDAVAARLDRVLAGLADEPAREAAVVRLADRRRRAATMLVAAAASVAAVIGVGQVLSGSGGSEDAASPTADSAESEAQAESGGSGPRAQGNDLGSAAGDQGLNYAPAQKWMPFSVQSERFAQDADELQSRSSTLSGLADDQDGTAPEETTSGAMRRVKNRTVCEPGSWGRGSYVAVVYDGAEGWVVLRQPQGETQVADLFLCGSEAVVRSVTLPYP